jgi:hydroxymethylpyrimidine pyrophosphatase-like HAD family hydrolase
MILLACDLDNTLISNRPQNGYVPVEYSGERVVTYAATQTLEIIANLDRGLFLVPATSRSIEQYKRIKLFHENLPAYAVVSGGGVILKDGEIDRKWELYRKNAVDSVRDEVERLLRLLQDDPRVSRVEIIDSSFIFAKSLVAPRVVDGMKLSAVSCGVLSRNEKVYILPPGIDKGSALAEVRRRLSAACVVAAGDSDLDVPLLNQADYALVPSHELAEKVSAPNVLVKPETVDFSVFIMEFAAGLAAFEKE